MISFLDSVLVEAIVRAFVLWPRGHGLTELSPHPRHLNPHMEVATRIDFSENERGRRSLSLAHVNVWRDFLSLLSGTVSMATAGSAGKEFSISTRYTAAGHHIPLHTRSFSQGF